MLGFGIVLAGAFVMTVHNIKRPYMIYEGPRPRRPAPVEPVVEHVAVLGGDARSETSRSPSRDKAFAVILMVAVALAAGVGIGFWLSPTLRPAEAILPAEPPAPAVGSLTRPAETPPLPAVVATAPPAAVEAVAAPAKAKAAPRKADRARAPKVLARNDTTVAPRALGGCRPDGSRAEVTICADPSIAAVDKDMQSAFQRALRSGAPAKALRAEQRAWLVVREQAARRSPSDLASAYRARVNELNAIADDPPH